MKIVTTEIYLRKLRAAPSTGEGPAKSYEERGRHATTTKALGAEASVNGPESCSRPQLFKPQILTIPEERKSDLCPGDLKPCYVSSGLGGNDAFWRCGTSSCPQPFPGKS